MNLNHEGIPWNAYTPAVTVTGGTSNKMIYPRYIARAIASLAIKETLEDIGKPVYEIADRLHKKYQCHIPDCYERPEYLCDVLNDLYGKQSREIMRSIDQELLVRLPQMN